MANYTFEDFTPGRRFEFTKRTLTADAIIAFAGEFDPQPMHLDEEAGRNSILGGLAASGWHTCAMFMRMLCDAVVSDSTSQGVPGVDQVRWKKPVLAGDTLTGRCTVLSKRLSRSRPQLGFVTTHSELFNQRGESVFELDNTAMFLTREAA